MLVPKHSKQYARKRFLEKGKILTSIKNIKKTSKLQSEVGPQVTETRLTNITWFRNKLNLNLKTYGSLFHF